MDAEEYAAGFEVDLRAAALTKPRSMQQTVGPSGFDCRSKMAYQIAGTPPTDTVPHLPALLGTFAHTGIEQIRRESNPHLLFDVNLDIMLPNGVVINGTADEIDPTEPAVSDYKTCGETSYRKAVKDGMSNGQLIQLHLYALGAIQAGLVEPEGLVLRDVFVRNDGKAAVHVAQVPFEPDIWIAEAVERWEHAQQIVAGEMDAPWDKPAYLCKGWCEWVSLCRPELKKAAA